MAMHEEDLMMEVITRSGSRVLKLFDNGDGTVSPVVRHIPIPGQQLKIKPGKTTSLDSFNHTGRLHAIFSDRPLELRDTQDHLHWRVEPSIPLSFARPLAFPGGIAIKNVGTADATVSIQFE